MSATYRYFAGCSLYLAQRSSPQGRGCRDPWVCLDTWMHLSTCKTIRNCLLMVLEFERCIYGMLSKHTRGSLHPHCWLVAEPAHRSISPYLLLSNVNEPESLSVRIIVHPIIHVGQIFHSLLYIVNDSNNFKWFFIASGLSERVEIANLHLRASSMMPSDQP